MPIRTVSVVAGQNPVGSAEVSPTFSSEAKNGTGEHRLRVLRRLRRVGARLSRRHLIVDLARDVVHPLLSIFFFNSKIYEISRNLIGWREARENSKREVFSEGRRKRSLDFGFESFDLSQFLGTYTVKCVCYR